ncbi:hypothetical protein DASC09_059830 [Saccharomycopsis crataegensis]|uniref:Uncharacterized protein n=1 Tax=Saccharomycopsis crataegensis TaxID=43959 RepID=A0AAV5QV11_9ASCO|nr:hypothetical protein DASC09_059830 [Saccharomycopsis crataegensis]
MTSDRNSVLSWIEDPAREKTIVDLVAFVTKSLSIDLNTEREMIEKASPGSSKCIEPSVDFSVVINPSFQRITFDSVFKSQVKVLTHQELTKYTSLKHHPVN